MVTHTLRKVGKGIILIIGFTSITRHLDCARHISSAIQMAICYEKLLILQKGEIETIT